MFLTVLCACIDTVTGDVVICKNRISPVSVLSDILVVCLAGNTSQIYPGPGIDDLLHDCIAGMYILLPFLRTTCV